MRKNLLSVFLFLYFLSNVNAQLSTEIYLTSPYYLTGFQNQFNYGGGIELSENFKRFKITAGIYFATKHFYDIHNIYLGNSGRINYTLDYINILLIAGFNLTPNQKRFHFYINTGVVLVHSYNYKSIIHFPDNLPAIDRVAKSYGLGVSARLGFRVDVYLNKRFNVFVAPFFDYKFNQDRISFEYEAATQIFADYSNTDKLSMGLNLGFEFFIRPRNQ